MKDFAHSDDPAVQAQLDRLAALSVPDGRLGLDTIRALLARLGDPQDRLPPVFHVAGTNGKGSTCAFLRAMLEADGRQVHVATSPHLVRYNERIRIAGKLIGDAQLAALLAEVLDASEQGGTDLNPSFFEVTIAATFLAFSRKPADACVVEVGLGGRFDATNVLGPDVLVACGIASLGIDHERFLLAPEDGVPTGRYARIAFEKAGIAKQGIPLLTMSYTPSMNEAIGAQALKAGAPLFRFPYDWSVHGDQETLVYADPRGKLTLPAPALPGLHQHLNAGLALAMLRHQHTVTVPDSALAAAMQWTKWPGRLQRLGNGPLLGALPRGTECWMDGGHNEDAGRALGHHFRHTGKRIHLVMGQLANKSPNAITLPLQPMLETIVIVPVPGHESHEAAAFDHIPMLPPRESAQGIEQALSMIAPRVGPDDIVLIAGSLYLAGEALRLNDELPE